MRFESAHCTNLYTNEKSIPFGGGVFLPYSQFITLLVLSSNRANRRRVGRSVSYFDGANFVRAYRSNLCNLKRFKPMKNFRKMRENTIQFKGFTINKYYKFEPIGGKLDLVGYWQADAYANPTFRDSNLEKLLVTINKYLRNEKVTI